MFQIQDNSTAGKEFSQTVYQFSITPLLIVNPFLYKSFNLIKTAHCATLCIP